MSRDLDARLTRLEALREDTGPVCGVAGVLAICARDRKDRLARGLPPHDVAASSPWAVGIRAAMARSRGGEAA